jgi:hypothetical protein
VKPPEERYRTDPMFRNVTDTLEALVIHAQLTPSEIREAAMLACIHHEMRVAARPHRYIVDPTNWRSGELRGVTYEEPAPDHGRGE